MTNINYTFFVNRKHLMIIIVIIFIQKREGIFVTIKYGTNLITFRSLIPGEIDVVQWFSN